MCDQIGKNNRLWSVARAYTTACTRDVLVMRAWSCMRDWLQ